MRNISIVIITGISGSGKSIALRALEDVGFFCIDNLPLSLFPKLIELAETNLEFNRLALVMDSRAPGFFAGYEKEYKSALNRGVSIETIFLDANEKAIFRRYSETRRAHPLHSEGDLAKSIELERRDAERLKVLASEVIDTSDKTVHELRKYIQDLYGPIKDKSIIHLTICSFGYKYGLPTDANLVLDVRFLANPYFVPELKAHNGESDAVKAFVLENPEAKTFLEKYNNLIDYLIPLYKKENKAYLTLALGCTGGRHRSVAISRVVFERLIKKGLNPSLQHRDIDRDLKEI